MRPILACLVVAPVLFIGCGADDPESGSEDITAASSPVLICPDGIGTSDRTFLQLDGSKLTVTVEGVAVQKASSVAGATSGGQAFSNFTGKGEFSKKDKLTLSKSLLAGKTGKATLQTGGTNVAWEGTCKKATKAQLSADQCIPQLTETSFIDTETMTEAGSTTASRSSSTHYAVRIPDAKVGDLTWDADVTQKGLFCRVDSLTAKSCAARVAEAAYSKAIDEGSSSGSPFVEKLAKNKFKAGVYDVESGDFVYTIVTSSEGDGCAITSVTAVTE
jgi:hypothetical protein